MGLKIAVIAGGAFEAERSLAAANDVMAALKEAEPRARAVPGGRLSHRRSAARAARCGHQLPARR